MPAPRLRDLALVALYLAIAIVPVVTIRLPAAHRTAVHGALPPTRRPALTASAFASESYQKQFTAWFESALGFRGVYVHADNSVLLHGFGETKPGARVKIGDDDVLYEADDLAYFSKSGADLPTPEVADGFAAKVALAQQRLRARGRSLVAVIAPSKASIYRAEIPPRWNRHVGAPPPSDRGVYQLLRDSFDRHGVRYVDGRALLAQVPVERRLLWGVDARHWSAYAACLVMARVVEVSGQAAPSYPCNVSTEAVRIGHVDHDLARLLNAWGVPAAPTVPVVAAPTTTAPGPRPRTLITGTSFSWTLLRDAQRAGVFGPLSMNYYNATFVLMPDDRHVPVELGTPTWNDQVLGAELHVLELVETYALSPDTYSFTFLDQLLAALPP